MRCNARMALIVWRHDWFISSQELDWTDTMPLNEEGLIDRVSIRHSVSADAVRTILRALRSGGGSMAQFSHPDFGGMSQWSPGMTMVGDMFNNGLKSKLDVVCTELANVIEMLANIDHEGQQKTYYILIDRLDENWVDVSLRFKLIRGLVESLKAFRKIRD